MVWGFKIHEVGFHPLPILFLMSKGQLEQNLVVYRYATYCLQNHNKIGDVTTGLLISFFVFGVKVQLLSNFLSLERSSKNLVEGSILTSDFIFHLNFVKQNEFDKLKSWGFMSFSTNFT